MQTTVVILVGLLMVGGVLQMGALAHSDTGSHVGFNGNLTGLDMTDAEDGSGAPCWYEDESICYYGDNDAGYGSWPGVSTGPSGWYYGSVTAWTEAQAGPDITVVPPDTLPEPLDDGVNLHPGFLFAASFGSCDWEVLGPGTGPDGLDENWVNGIEWMTNSQPDGVFNDGGFGAVCHTSETFYTFPQYNAPGCNYPNAQALDAVSGEDIWISTSCDWETPAIEADLLDHLLSLTSCAAISVRTGWAPGATFDCVNTFVTCAITGVGCPSPGTSFCGADGMGDASESGQGDAGHLGFNGVASGVPYPRGSFVDYDGNVCTDLAAAVFVWNAVVVDVGLDVSDPNIEALSLASKGWVSTAIGYQGCTVCLPSSSSASYESNGNRACDAVELVANRDKDGDGQADCSDPDDDGDWLTDQFEDEKSGSGYDRSKRDSDGDGVEDSLDVLNLAGGIARVVATAKNYDHVTECGDSPDGWFGSKRPDPYIDIFMVQLLGGGTAAGTEVHLNSPPKWQEGDHVAERGDNVVHDLVIDSQNAGDVIKGVWTLPQSISQFPRSGPSDDSFPRFILKIGLMDNDGNADDRIDLMEGSSTVATLQDVGLNLDSAVLRTKEGDDPNCHARIGFQFEDNIPFQSLRTAVYHYANPTTIIGVTTPLPS